MINSPEICMRVKNISRNFGGLQALKNVSFDVGAQQIFGIMGPNGAGKTTLLNILSGFDIASSGGLELHGKNILGQSASQIARLGVARTFQNIRLWKQQSVFWNVKMGFGNKNHKSTSNALTVDCLKSCGLAKYSEMPAGLLPYGIQRRVEIARAIAVTQSNEFGKLMLLDEPAAGLDLVEKNELAEFLVQIQSELKLSLILIEHHVPLMMRICERLAVLDFGNCIAIGTPQEISEHPEVIAAYLGTEDTHA